MNAKQHALAAEIRAEAAAQRITAKDIQRLIGVSSSSWSNYFVACTRDVPMGVVVGVAEVLGMSGSELLRRAEVRAAQAPPADPIRDELESKLTKRGRRQVEQARQEYEGGGGGVDPHRRSRADVDDGRSDDVPTSRSA